MNKKNVIIITGEGGRLGTGHFQRMCTLASILNKTCTYSAGIIIAEGKPVIPDGIENLLVTAIPPGTSLIIRDMRDSSAAEIESLRKNAPVLVIDDTGAGRSHADHVLDILPSPLCARTFSGIFIYGYNFITTVNTMNFTEFTKDIDVAIYAGYKPDMALIENIVSRMPYDISCVLLSGDKIDILRGRVNNMSPDYIHALIRSRILITHFGITMYEGELAGCRILALNPTHYHTELTLMVTERLNVVPAGEYDSIDHNTINHEISTAVNRNSLDIVSSRSIKERIDINLEYLRGYIKNLLS